MHERRPIHELRDDQARTRRRLHFECLHELLAMSGRSLRCLRSVGHGYECLSTYGGLTLCSVTNAGDPCAKGKASRRSRSTASSWWRACSCVLAQEGERTRTVPATSPGRRHASDGDLQDEVLRKRVVQPAERPRATNHHARLPHQGTSRFSFLGHPWAKGSHRGCGQTLASSASGTARLPPSLVFAFRSSTKRRPAAS